MRRERHSRRIRASTTTARRFGQPAARAISAPRGRPSGNFEIFRTASRHLVSGQDLYAEYPAEHTDRFKYSPTFALLFQPFAWIPWPLALLGWNLLNALLLFVAVERVLPPRRAQLAQALLLLEVLRGMQNAQSNALVSALIVFAFVALERQRIWRAALAVALGVCVKIFPLAALTFAIARRRAIRTGIATARRGLRRSSPCRSCCCHPPHWPRNTSRGALSRRTDAQQRWFSVMELLHRITGVSIPNWPIQLAGTLALLAPLALRRDRWDDARFRLLYLCSLLLYVVLFNHQAERASYLIAFAGATIWFASEPAARWRTGLYGVALLTIPLMSTIVPGAWLRTQMATTWRLALPCLAIWLVIQGDCCGARRWLRAPPRRQTSCGVDVELDVALQRG